MHLAQVLFGVNQRLRIEDVDSPLIQIRPVKNCLVAVVTGDRGLCGGYNNFVIKKARRKQFTQQQSLPSRPGRLTRRVFFTTICFVL